MRLASRCGRYGYRRVTDMLRIEGWGVKHKRVERIWRQEGLKVPGAAAEARSAVAQRRIVHPAEAAVSGPRLVVRFRGLEDARRACAEAADSAGRAHEGVPGDRGGSQDPSPRRARGAGRSVRPTRASRVSEVGQRTGVHREVRAEMAGQAAGPDPLHRAGQSVGERLQRELQRQTERRVLERRDLLHTARGNGTRRAVEAAVQYRPTPSCPRRTTPRPRDDKTIRPGSSGCPNSRDHRWLGV